MGAVLSLAAADPAAAAVIRFQEGAQPAAAYGHVGQDFREGGGTNNGAQLLVGNQPPGAGDNRNIRGVLAFDLGEIPAGATINNVSLRLVSDGSPAGTLGGFATMNAHQVTPNGNPANAMAEGQISWTNWKTGTPWTAPGGDYQSTILSSGTVTDADSDNAADAGEAATLASTAAFVSAAQASLDGGFPLQLILIAPTPEANDTNTFVRFRSDNHATAADRPLLTVDYTPVPEPGSAALLATSAGLLLARRRRRRCQSGPRRCVACRPA